jgi:hypothetical protein
MTSQKSITVKFGNLFPWIFLLVALAVLVMALLTATDRPTLSICLMLASGIVLTGQEGTEIDRYAKRYREYKSFFFIKSGRWINYAEVEKIFVNTSKSSQRLYTAHTTKSSIFENVDYNGFLKFADGKKVHLLKKRKKAELLDALNPIAGFLDVPLEDNLTVTT